MDFTPYNNFPKPADDEAFGDEYRGFADNLDSKVREEGPIADRPASAPTGAVYDATDQQVRYRYDGSAWEVIAGIGSAAKPLPSVNVEELSVSSTQVSPYVRDAREGAAASYSRVGDPEDLEYTSQVVGTRQLAAHWRMFPVGGPMSNGQAYSNTGSRNYIQLIRYSFLEQPPNTVPVLKGVCSLKCDSSGSLFEIGVKLREASDQDFLLRFRAGTDTDVHHLYDEIRLDEEKRGSAARGSSTLADTAIEVYAGILSHTEGTIYPGSQLMLEWEVV
jgi:hypothetical protein